MYLYPENISKLLRFEDIQILLKKYCFSELGMDLVENQVWIHDKIILEKELRKVVEFKNIIQFDNSFPALTYFNLKEALEHINIQNFYLDIEIFIQIRENTKSIELILNFFKDRNDKSEFKELESIVRSTFFDQKIIQLIDQVIDEKGSVKPNASATLMEIKQGIQATNKQIDRVYQTTYKELSNKGFLTDTEETIRNGRRVFSIFSEHKRAIHGIIHDESETGKTTYIEPEQVIFLNNQLSELYRDEQREIRKILIQLTAQMGVYTSLIIAYQDILGTYDYIRAKGRLAVEMNGNKPIISESVLKIKSGFHPLLLLLNNGKSKKTIPFEVELNDKKHVLLISGPNAGGKSVTMNAIGLLSMMLQMGLLIPCDENSSFKLFDQIFADLSDAQSIEDELSTYSSKLKHMNHFIELSERNTLILIDEMGSGTDPMFGGAMAEAVLQSIINNKAYTIVTTHFGNLKSFGDKNEFILNGCMLFDEENLAPTYQMSIGKPGSSYTFEIAKKSGLKDNLINHAKSLLDQDSIQYDLLLNRLEQKEIEINKKIDELSNSQKELSLQIKKWQRLSNEMEINKKKIQYERMTDKQSITIEKKKHLNEFIADIKRTDKEILKLEMKVLEEEVYNQQEQIKKVYRQIHKNDANTTIKIGSKVRYLATDPIGIVEKIKDNKAIVVFGNIKSTLPIEDLISDASVVNEIGKNKKIIDISKKSQISSELDLRGKFKLDAIMEVENYIDKAILNNMWQFKIIHGTGALKKAVWDTLRGFPQLSKYYHPEKESGGEGATIVIV